MNASKDFDEDSANCREEMFSYHQQRSILQKQWGLDNFRPKIFDNHLGDGGGGLTAINPKLFYYALLSASIH